MKSVNEQLAEMQKKTLESLEPMQNMNAVAAEAFERIARKNYALMGDLVDYAVSQVRMPKPDADIKEIYEQRIADTKAFAEKVNERAAEYVALAGELGEMAQAKTAAKSAANKSATGTGTTEKKADSAKTKSTKPAAPKTEAAESVKPATAEQVKPVTAESNKTSTPSATPAKAAEPVAKAAAPKKAATPAKASASSAKKKASATKKSTAKAK